MIWRELAAKGDWNEICNSFWREFWQTAGLTSALLSHFSGQREQTAEGVPMDTFENRSDALRNAGGRHPLWAKRAT